MAIKQAVQELNIPKHNLVMVTGIGCNSKMNQYFDCYGAETLHGRGVPFATGVKLANPELTVISVSGDGDTYGIGLGHLLNAARRDINIVHITCDNENYALTTGQASPTTPEEIKTKSTPQGNPTRPLDPIALLKAVGCESVTSVEDKDIKLLKETIMEAIQHQGFSHVNVQQTCPSWKKWE
ncbi:MAG: thiamine pyrophosphate-dependent enzyme [Candidatus Absconditabacteria bacterium]|nr:thiamine pyrophosphate-dependent enzyme [Candidatus Absconditabacteria bacterium]